MEGQLKGGRYELAKELGSGGMGVVYLAHDIRLKCNVALKEIRAEHLHDLQFRRRLAQEAHAAAAISHAGIARAVDFMDSEQESYIVYEFVEGLTLRDQLYRRRFTTEEILDLGIKVADALAAAHAQGFIHRDLKPENLMLTPRPDGTSRVKILDFGLAKRHKLLTFSPADSGTETEAGSITTTATVLIGTINYMSPEQLGDTRKEPVDARSDIYALGLILYEMATGINPFKGETVTSTITNIVTREAPPIQERNAVLPAKLDQVIRKCLRKRREERYQTADELVAALSDLRRRLATQQPEPVKSVDELEAALTREREAKPAAVEGEGAEVSLPISLATWQRSDWFLLASGVLGAVVFFLLFYRFHPASALVIAYDAEQQKQVVADAVKKLQWDVEVGQPSLWLYPEFYYEHASLAGTRAAQEYFLHSGSIGGWGGRFRKSEGEGKSPTGDYQTDFHGKLQGLSFHVPGAVTRVQPGPAPDEASMARMKEIAQSTAQTLFGENLSPTKALAKASWYPPGQCWRVGFSWALPQQSQGFVTEVNVQVEGSRVASAWRWARFESSAEQEFDWEAYSPPVRYFAAGLMMVWFALILFFARRMYREPRSPQNLRLAILIGLGGAVAMASPLTEFGGPLNREIYRVVWGVIIFSVVTLLSYTVLSTALYYMRRRFPVQAANYLQLFREHVFARTAGLEMLRGVFAGAGFGGVWMALVSLGGLWGKALAGMPFWLQAHSGFEFAGVDVISPFQARVFPVLLIGEVLLIAWLLVALPLSLLSRATVRWKVLLAALSALWMALGFSLAGTMVFPTWPYLIFVVLQAIFCGVVFLRYGLLATLSAVFTIEVGLLAFPLLEIFQNIDPLPYTIPVVLWFLLLLAAAGLYFRPQAVGAYRRMAAVFE